MPHKKVILVGAGPGDQELITLKGLKTLTKADVVLYDHLIPIELLTHCKPDAELISVGKYSSNHTLSQEEINALLIEKAKQGNMVVRLKGGDCYLFGRGGEEAEACYDAGIEFEVVPGVTSALAAPSYAGIPPTHRDYTSNVAIVTGHRKQGDQRPIEIPLAGTVIFLMSVANIENLIGSLLAAGYSEDSLIAAVEHGTCYDQRVLKGTLKTFPEVIRKNPLRPPAIFIVGKVVELQDKLDWFSKKPRILHLGHHPERYSELGIIVHRPIIRCEESEKNEQTNRLVRQAGVFQWIIFTSGNGVQFFFKKLHAAGLDARVFANTKFAVIGKATGERLVQFGIRADLCPATESSRGLSDEFEKIRIKGHSVLLPQAEISSDELPAGLSASGANVERLAVYRTVENEIEDVDLDYIDKILFTSGSTVRAFFAKFGDVPKHIEALCLGIPTQMTAKQYGIEAAIIQKDVD